MRKAWMPLFTFTDGSVHRTSPRILHHFSGGPYIEEPYKPCGNKVCHRLRPHKSGHAQPRLQNKQCGDINDTLTAQIDNQRRRSCPHGLQGIAQRIEYAEQEACSQQYVRKLHRIVVSSLFCQKHADDLPAEQIAKRCHDSAEPQGKEKRTENRIVFRNRFHSFAPTQYPSKG